MLSMQFIRDNQKRVQQTAIHKNIPFQVEELLAWDAKRKELLRQTEAIRARRNELSKEVAPLMKQGNRGAAEPLMAQVKDMNETLAPSKRNFRRPKVGYRSCFCSFPMSCRRIRRSARTTATTSRFAVSANRRFLISSRGTMSPSGKCMICSTFRGA